MGKLGRYDDQNCGSGHRGSTTYWEDPINAPVGEPVVGDGTIGNLYLMADVWGTEVDRNITGYVYVNGIQTVVGCQLLPINDLVGTHPTYTMLTSGKHMECITPESVTAPVNHRDKIKVVLAGFDMGPWIVDVHVLLGKW